MERAGKGQQKGFKRTAKIQRKDKSKEQVINMARTGQGKERTGKLQGKDSDMTEQP